MIPSVMPKPDLMPLTGGYRKTPVLQIGADVYCDTALICDVLEHLAPTPSLYNKAPKGLVRSVAQWADTLLFPVAMAYNFQPQGAAHVMASFTPETVKAFAADRQAMRGGGARMHHADGTGMYKSQLRRIASMLEHQVFLLGDTPCLADFSVYHSVWFTQVQVPMLAGILDATPVVKAWTARIAAFGQGSPTKMSAEEGLGGGESRHPLWPCRMNFSKTSMASLWAAHGHGGRRKFWHRTHHRRIGGRHAHPLHLAPRTRTNRHGARAFPPLGLHHEKG